MPCLRIRTRLFQVPRYCSAGCWAGFISLISRRVLALEARTLLTSASDTEVQTRCSKTFGDEQHSEQSRWNVQVLHNCVSFTTDSVSLDNLRHCGPSLFSTLRCNRVNAARPPPHATSTLLLDRMDDHGPTPNAVVALNFTQTESLANVPRWHLQSLRPTFRLRLNNRSH